MKEDKIYPTTGPVVPEFLNTGEHEFIDISVEMYREYLYADGTRLRYVQPLKLAISNNGHRLFLRDGRSVYVPYGWRALEWMSYPGKPNFVI